MTQFYFDVDREHSPYALPDGEVFYAEEGDWWYKNDQRVDEPSCSCKEEESEEKCVLCEGAEPCGAGFYWWSCLPGCLPDSDPHGPFDTEEEAIEDARGDF